MLFQLTCILSRHRFPALDTWQASQSCDTLLCSQDTLSPKQAAAAPCSKPSTCPLLFSSGAPWSTSCSAEAELSSSPSLVALRASYGEKTIWRYTLVCRMQCIPAKLGLQILCGMERLLLLSETACLCDFYVHFDLLSHSHFFFEYCKSPLKAVFRNSTLKPRISTLPVLPKYLTSLNKCISIFHPQKNYILFFLRARSVLNQCTPESTVGCPSSINTEISGGLGEHPSRGEVWFQRSFQAIVMVIFKNKLLAKM